MPSKKSLIHQELAIVNLKYPQNISKIFEFGLLFPEWEFIVFNDERYTYQDIHKKAAQTANALKNAGVKKGDRVAICMANNPEYIISFMAVTSMGAVVYCLIHGGCLMR
jgi:long-chain acyl-CoA synthetase